ncbi:MAG: hypothetical protein ABJG15_09070 [Hyphomonadaceae bacterium]
MKMPKPIAVAFAFITFVSAGLPAHADQLSEETGQRIAQALERIAAALEQEVPNDESSQKLTGNRGRHHCSGGYASRRRLEMDFSDSSACLAEIKQTCIVQGYDDFRDLDVLTTQQTIGDERITNASIIYECTE